VKAIFKGIKGPQKDKDVEILNLVGESGDNWSVTFENDETALMVLEALRDIKFQDKPIQARIKTEFVQRNYFVPGAPSENSYGYSYPGNVYMMPSYPQGPYPQYYNNPQTYRENPRGRGYGRGRRKDFGGRGGGRGKGAERGGKESTNNGGVSTRKRRGSQGNPNIQLGTADFPPLPSAAFEQSKTRYTDDFIKYNKQEIVDIVSNLGQEKQTKPSDMPQIEKVIMDESDSSVEVTKPYPKRVTAAEIVQMTPISPKDSKDVPIPETTPKNTSQNSSPPKEKSEKPRNSEKSRSSKSEKSQHNGNSKQASKHNNNNSSSSNDAKSSQT